VVSKRTRGPYRPARKRTSTSFRTVSYLDEMTKALRLRTWPIVVSVVYVCLALAYFFWWGSVVQHIPSSWTMPYDYAYTYLAASQLAHGHFNAIYNSHVSFVEFPGIVVAMAPLGALSNVFHTTLLEVVANHAYVIPHYSVHYSSIPFLTPGWLIIGGKLFVPQPQWAVAVGLYALLLGCIALFACDALARRLQVSQPRRAVLSVVEAVLLWNVTVLWGHPEDAVAVALAMYALIFALDGRFVGAGWLFGAAVAFQPLVLLMLPVLLALAGRRNGLGLAIRSILPAALLVTVPLIANFSVTFHALAEQPNYPNRDHATPWTALSPHLGGNGLDLAVAGGPGRVLAILLAVLVGIWVAKRWRDRPELLVFACALVFALRSYTESVMDAYYPWAALAVGVVVAARCSRWRFSVAIALAIAATIIAQWSLAWLPWWTIQIGALTALLIVAAQPKPLELATQLVNPRAVRTKAIPGGQPGSTSAKKNAPGRARATAAAPRRSGSDAANKRRAPPSDTKRSGRR
jgi:hypothetical protein